MEKPWLFPGNKRQASADHGRPRRFRWDEDRSKTTKNHLILTSWPTFFFSTTQKSLFLLTFSCHSKCENKVPPKPELTLSRDDFSDLAHGLKMETKSCMPFRGDVKDLWLLAKQCTLTQWRQGPVERRRKWWPPTVLTRPFRRWRFDSSHWLFSQGFRAPSPNTTEGSQSISGHQSRKRNFGPQSSISCAWKKGKERQNAWRKNPDRVCLKGQLNTRCSGWRNKKLAEVPDQKKEVIRIRVCDAIKRSRQPEAKFSTEERRALKKLQTDKKIKILHADKGNATVVMDTKDYDKKGKTLLQDEDSYSRLDSDPTRATERKLLSLLRSLKKNGKITDRYYDQVRPSEGASKPALFYGRAKLHKPSTPLRPVVATCGTSTYALAKSLAAVLKPLVGYSGRILRSTSDLIDVMKTVTVNDDELLVSYDVKSLFTSIPVKESIEVCEERLRQDNTLADRTSMDVETIISLLRFCLTSTSFQYGGKHFKQVDGVAMGSPVSSVIADIFMENLEMKAFQGYGTVPRVWKRFVDDVLAVVRKAEVERFLDHLNNTHPNILHIHNGTRTE